VRGHLRWDQWPRSFLLAPLSFPLPSLPLSLPPSLSSLSLTPSLPPSLPPSIPPSLPPSVPARGDQQTPDRHCRSSRSRPWQGRCYRGREGGREE
jgi:hypothetical protein